MPYTVEIGLGNTSLSINSYWEEDFKLIEILAPHFGFEIKFSQCKRGPKMISAMNLHENIDGLKIETNLRKRQSTWWDFIQDTVEQLEDDVIEGHFNCELNNEEFGKKFGLRQLLDALNFVLDNFDGAEKRFTEAHLEIDDSNEILFIYDNEENMHMIIDK